MAIGLSICIGSILIYIGLWYIVMEIRTVTVAIDELAGEIRRHD